MIYIVRHGETDCNKYRRYQGRIDVYVNGQGQNLKNFKVKS